jgi:hypothetical protein
MSLTVGLFTVVVLIGSWFTTPAFATFCQISSISYNYPQQVLPGQSFSTTVTVSGVCAPDDANYYSVRSDLNDISGFVLSAVSVPIGFSQGQNWTVNVQNQVTAPTSSASWQIQFAVYIFAAVGSGGALDSAAFKPVTIQVGTTQPAQTSTSIGLTTTQTEAPPVMISTALTSITAPNQTTETAQPSLDVYRGVAAVLVLILLVMIVVLIKQRQNKHNA